MNSALTDRDVVRLASEACLLRRRGALCVQQASMSSTPRHILNETTHVPCVTASPHRAPSPSPVSRLARYVHASDVAAGQDSSATEGRRLQASWKSGPPSCTKRADGAGQVVEAAAESGRDLRNGGLLSDSAARTIPERSSPGVRPNIRRVTRVKCGWSANPASVPASAGDAWGSQAMALISRDHSRSWLSAAPTFERTSARNRAGVRPTSAARRSKRLISARLSRAAPRRDRPDRFLQPVGSTQSLPHRG
jgi:hypothetical protein